MISIERDRTRCSHVVWDFDAPGLARTIERLRRDRGLSTRGLAAGAAISQSYVVALERARRATAATSTSVTPTPTVDVLARLAHALGVAPATLLDASLRRSGRHVLCVVDDTSPSAMRVAARTARDVGAWVWVGPAAADDAAAVAEHAEHRIDLDRDGSHPYDPAAVSHALRRRLQSLPSIDGEQLGIVFAETSTVLRSLPEPTPIVEFEHTWNDVVARAAWSAGAHASWNVCVYELDAIRSLDDPLEVGLELIRSHDEVWCAHRSTIDTGSAGALRLLTGVRPPSVGADAWKARCRSLLADLARCG